MNAWGASEYEGGTLLTDPFNGVPPKGGVPTGWVTAGGVVTIVGRIGGIAVPGTAVPCPPGTL